MAASKYFEYCEDKERDYRTHVRFHDGVRICSRMEGTDKFAWVKSKGDHALVL